MNQLDAMDGKQRKKTPPFSLGIIVGTLGLAFGGAMWAMQVTQLSPEEDPNWVPLSKLEQKQSELDVTAGQLQKLQQEHRQDQQRFKLARQAETQLTAQLRQSIPVSDLPVDLQAANPQLTLNNINQLWNDQQAFNRDTAQAMLHVLAQILETGIINTTRPADDPNAQQLYREVQIVLQAVGTYQGSITGDQKQTYQALTDFQKSRKLKIDGKMGLKTFGAMAETIQKSLVPTQG